MGLTLKDHLPKLGLLSAYRYLSSGKILPIIILVLLPMTAILIYGSLSYVIANVVLFFSFFVMIILYAPYRAAYSTADYFKRRGYDNVVNEYIIIKYILYVAIPAFIFLTIVSFKPEYQRYFDAVLGPDMVFALRLSFFSIVVAGLIKTMLQLARKEFRFHFARGCIDLANKEDEIDMMKYLIWGLNAYNSFLRRYLKLEINNLKKIYSKISSSPLVERKKLRESLDVSFDSGKLQPLQLLSKYLSPEEKEQLLVKESFTRKVKEAAAFMAIVIPIMISLFEFLGVLPRNLTSGGG